MAAAILALAAWSGAAVRAQVTEANGTITGDNWLILGPFANPFACNGSAADQLGNHIGPTEIGCEFPQDGDIVDYDPGQSVSTGYVGPDNGDGPFWRPLSLGAAGNINLDADVNGDQIDVMSWLATYIQYDGAEPIAVQLCVGSDDGVQVWLDDTLVHNNPACRGTGYCQDVPAVVITPGVHVIKVGIWENDGGWGFSLALTINGVPVTDDAGLWPDWVFLGTGGETSVPGCEPQVPGQAVISPACTKRVDGGLNVSWTNPPDANPGVQISIYAGGNRVGTVPGTATSAVVAAGDLNDQNDVVCVVNSSGIPGCCSAQITTLTGLIKSPNWLVLGPFTQTFACNGNNASLLGNHIYRACIQGEYPVAGQEIDYDPGPAASTGYVGPPSTNGQPFWRPFDDRSDNGDIDLDADLGDQSTVMSWLATYIEYKGDTPVMVDLCVSSDDGIQVWLDDQMVINNNACRGRDINICQDLVSVEITPGTHRVAMGIWENGGGWGGSFAMQMGGVAITDDIAAFPDWQFWGRTKPPGFTDIPCPSCLLPVTNVQCRLVTGLPSGLEVTWTVPAECNLADLPGHSVRVNGEELATVGPTNTRTVIQTARLPQGTLLVEVVNASGIPAFCCFQKTDNQGSILTSKWLVLGPFSQPFGCNGNNDSILGNHIGPSHICQQYPQLGDEVDYDPAQSVSTGYVGPLNDNNLPFWRQLDDGGPCDGDHNLDADAGSDLSDVMSWMITYIEYAGAGAIDVELCLGSDDGVQVWLDDELIHNNNACRGRAVCQDVVPFTLSPGVHRLAMGVWENDGGWGGSLALRDASGPILDDGTRDDIIFHGTERPGTVGDFPECSPPCPPVDNVSCSRNGDGSVTVRWTNPACDNPAPSILILVDGGQVGNVPAGSTSFTVPAASVPAGVARISVDNGAVIARSCGISSDAEIYINAGGPELTDLQGRVWTEDTLANPSPFLTSANANVADFGNPAGVNLTADAVVSANEYPAEIFPLERWADGPVEYTISGLPVGDYELTLLFMEGCCSDLCEDIPDPALSAGTCRVVDVLVNDELVEDQFAQNVVAARTAGVAPGVGANFIAIARVYELTGVGSVKVLIQDLGPGDPPQNASIKGIALTRVGGGGGARFHRGDADVNGSVQLTDAVRILNYLFQGTGEILCEDAADSDDNGVIQLTDAVRILNYLFQGTGVIPAPGPTTEPCGPDPTDDALGCVGYPAVNC